ncbi:DUF397 domain-containing protein [Streptomyces sp. PTM05]|uniref:DUF397 domain-containing protein n=1 Tax=Streptantibioticus parmotrematis TaxID=2873249 RepID=A0ABS7QRF5_9ACTN|nr:DUF397 domain-containing protein [Streptantibioticus parmotrematis]MBY8885762.1 DUF397 domain-containing protein [Streptantibioticus parmotrematis]
MSTTPDLTQATWVKSTHSNGDGGDCIEWAPAHAAATGVIPVRDSKDPQGPALAFPTHAWNAFIGAVKSGAFPADAG